MGTIVILGTANAVPDDRHENTHLLVQEGQRTILVDCTGNPLAELKRAGVNPDQLTDVILTHFHPDHVSGVPLLLMDLWLSGRKHGIRIHGLADTLGRMQTMMKLFDCESWPNFFTVDYHILPDIAQAELLADEEVELLLADDAELLADDEVELLLADDAELLADDDAELLLADDAELLADGPADGQKAAQCNGNGQHHHRQRASEGGQDESHRSTPRRWHVPERAGCNV